MTKSLQSFFDSHAREVIESRYAEAAQRYTYPCAIYHAERVMLIPDIETGEQQMRLQVERLKEAGVARIEPRLAAMPVTRSAQFTAWVEWHQYRADDTYIGKSFQRFFMRRTDTSYTIMMLEALQYSLPAIADALPWNLETQKLLNRKG